MTLPPDISNQFVGWTVGLLIIIIIILLSDAGTLHMLSLFGRFNTNDESPRRRLEISSSCSVSFIQDSLKILLVA
jgi:membrane-bound metal-dependent hydrolase YbcI (DUF457 family)